MTLAVKVPTELTPWEPSSGRRIAGVSAFGFSGTNAHVILEEAPAPVSKPAGVERPLHLLTLSAKSSEALEALAERYGHHMKAHPSQSLSDVCFTANAGRAHFNHRLAVICDESSRIEEKLLGFRGTDSSVDILSNHVKGTDRVRVAFLFTGQGSQYVNMGRELYETQPTFRRTLDRCAALLEGQLDIPLLSVLYPESDHTPVLDETAYTQPVLFALEYSLAELWRSWGIEPSVVMGHSVGEYVAACVAGVFSLEDGIRLISARGRLMQALPAGGRMVAVFADEARVASSHCALSEDGFPCLCQWSKQHRDLRSWV